MFFLWWTWLDETNPGASQVSEQVCSASRYNTHQKNDSYFKPTSPLQCFICRFKGLVCMQHVWNVQRKNCLKGLSLHIRVTCDTTLRVLSAAGAALSLTSSQSRHVKPETRRKTCSISSCVWSSLCTGSDRSYPTDLPLRCKQHCVCHLQFQVPPFCDRQRSVPVSTF